MRYRSSVGILVAPLIVLAWKMSTRFSFIWLHRGKRGGRSRQAFGLPEVLVAVRTSHLSCKSAGKTRTLMPVWDSSGESRLILKLGDSLTMLPAPPPRQPLQKRLTV